MTCVDLWPVFLKNRLKIAFWLQISACTSALQKGSQGIEILSKRSITFKNSQLKDHSAQKYCLSDKSYSRVAGLCQNICTMTDGQSLHLSLFIFKKNLHSIFICATPQSYLYQHSIDFRINMTGNKNRENVKIRKCIFKTVKFENVYYHKMQFKIYYNMKFIIPRT